MGDPETAVFHIWHIFASANFARDPRLHGPSAGAPSGEKPNVPDAGPLVHGVHEDVAARGDRDHSPLRP